MAPRVASYMSDEVIVVRPWENLAHVRRLMLRHNVGRIIVTDEDEKPVGIITLTDIVDAILNKYPSRPINTLTAQDVMTTDVKTITPRKSVRHAAQIMARYKIGGLPVVGDDGRLKGIITRTDITRAYADHHKGEHKVRDLMREAYATANPYHAIYHIARLSSLDPAGKVIIVDDEGRPIGIITKRDLAFTSISYEVRMSRGKDRFRKVKSPDIMGRDKVVAVREYFVPLAKDIMSEDLVTIKGDEDAAYAAQIMVANGIGALPVVDDEGRLIGLITKHEFVKAVASS